MRSSIRCSVHNITMAIKMKDVEMGRAYSGYGKNEKCIENFG
jgi:hypothetical protein